LKRSNRLVLLIGVFLAIVAFIGIVLIFQGGGRTGTPSTPVAPTELPTVFATRDIPLGTEISADMVRTANLAVASRDATAFQDTSLVVGKIARKDIASGKQLTADDFDTAGLLTTVNCPPNLRCIAVQVDQVSGVGTIIRTGDYIDMLVAFTGDKFPIIIPDPETQVPTILPGVNPTTSKLLLQGMQVVGHILPPPPAPAEGAEPPSEGTALTGQQEIVIIAGDAQQVEVIKFAQLDGSVSLVLRSPQDFRDPTTGDPIIPAPADTTGVTLSLLVNEYDVLIPQLIEAVLPEQAGP
jgi:pilus assembly protein CpaB